MTTLVERLGYEADAKLLIITASGLGGCHAMNDGVYESVRSGLATGAVLQVPSPWTREAAARYRGDDVGIELTLNAEFELYRWGPLTHAPSLLGGDGGFPQTVADTWDHADPTEVRRECHAQIERAILWGFDLTHLSSHLDVLVARPELFDIYLELAVEFSLPIRLLDSAARDRIGFPIEDLARAENVIFTDRVVASHSGIGGRALMEQLLLDLEAGVTEVHLHPAADRPELRAVATDWAARIDDLDVLNNDPDLRLMIERSGAALISHRNLRDAMRAPLPT